MSKAMPKNISPLWDTLMSSINKRSAIKEAIEIEWNAAVQATAFDQVALGHLNQMFEAEQRQSVLIHTLLFNMTKANTNA